MDTSDTLNATSPASVLFARGVIARLAIWSVLRIAIEHGWGGPHGVEKRRWLASVIVDAFEEQLPPPDAIYVEEMLLQVMADEFETVVEDSSVEIVANDIVRLWDEVHCGMQSMVLRFEEQSDKLKGKVTGAQELSNDEEWEDEDDSSSDDEELPRLLDHGSIPQKDDADIDEEGFTMVKGKGRRQ